MTDECIKPSTDDGNHRAAQYVRMSTEHQKYSTENQSEAITRYASARGLNIVRSYADEGKSGLKLDGREALQSLIADVEAGLADYANILVYDVSRWGRFQNADEAAYLEHIGTRAGIAVHYCAEQFENDGSIAATIIKSMKRAMAGEMNAHLGYRAGEDKQAGPTSRRTQRRGRQDAVDQTRLDACSVAPRPGRYLRAGLDPQA